MTIEMNVKKRDLQGTGASRRLRRAAQVPAIIYGGDKPATMITLDHNEIFHALRKEAFHSSVLTLNVDGEKETVLLRDTQMHAYKLQVLHVDFQRVDATHKLHTKVPFHFVNADAAPGVAPGRHRVARDERDRRAVPAEPAAGIHRSRPVRPVGWPVDPRVADQAAGWR